MKHRRFFLRGSVNGNCVGARITAYSNAGFFHTCEGMLRLGLMEYTSMEDPAARYTLLSRCMIVPAKPSKRNALRRDEKILLDWMLGAGFRLSLAELVYLFDNRVRPTKDLLGKENMQALVDRIYPDQKIEDHVLEAKMADAAQRDAVVDAVLGLLKKKRVVLL